MLLKVTSFFILLFAIIITSSAQATCLRDASGAIIVDADNTTRMVSDSAGMTDQCSEIPDAYLIKFFKMGICTADPIDPDFSSCSFMLDNSNGVDQ